MNSVVETPVKLQRFVLVRTRMLTYLDKHLMCIVALSETRWMVECVNYGF